MDWDQGGDYQVGSLPGQGAVRGSLVQLLQGFAIIVDIPSTKIWNGAWQGDMAFASFAHFKMGELLHGSQRMETRRDSYPLGLTSGSTFLRFAKPYSRWLLGWTLVAILSSGDSFAQEPKDLSRLREAQSMEDLSLVDRQRLENYIRELVVKLGDDRYSVRQRASEELQQVGLLAFEQLRQAQLSSDPQIATTASYLLQSIRQEWAWETDPLEVKELISNYANMSEVDRSSCIDRLARIGNIGAAVALARLCRYETHEHLSRHAAISILSMESPPGSSELAGTAIGASGKAMRGRNEEDEDIERAKNLRRMVGISEREGCLWIKQYAMMLDDGSFAIPFWIEVLKREEADLKSGRNLTTQVNLRSLARWTCQKMIAAGDREGALQLISSIKSLISPNPSSHELTDACHWALSVGLPEWVHEIATLHPARFAGNARLAYARAEGMLQQGRKRMRMFWPAKF